MGNVENTDITNHSCLRQYARWLIHFRMIIIWRVLKVRCMLIVPDAQELLSRRIYETKQIIFVNRVFGSLEVSSNIDYPLTFSR